jgi:hypothetical protein
MKRMMAAFAVAAVCSIAHAENAPVCKNAESLPYGERTACEDFTMNTTVFEEWNLAREARLTAPDTFDFQQELGKRHHKLNTICADPTCVRAWYSDEILWLRDFIATHEGKPEGTLARWWREFKTWIGDWFNSVESRRVRQMHRAAAWRLYTYDFSMAVAECKIRPSEWGQKIAERSDAMSADFAERFHPSEAELNDIQQFVKGLDVVRWRDYDTNVLHSAETCPVIQRSQVALRLDAFADPS